MITVHGNNVDVEQLHEVKVVKPQRAGRVWKGIQHGELVDAITDEVTSRGWKITDQQFSLSKNRADLAGAFELQIPNLEAPKDQAFSLGFITSNNMRRPLKLVVGTRVFVCNNGMATGQILMNKKHTINFDLYNELEYSIDEYMDKARLINNYVESLKNRNLTEPETEHILITAGRQGVMPWSRIGQVDEEYRNPTYQDHDERTSFGLLQAFTHIVKKNPPLEQMDQMSDFRTLLPTAA